MKNEVIIKAIEDLKVADTSSKTFLTECLNYLKTVAEVKQGVKALNNQVNEVADSLETPKHFVSRLKRLVKLAGVIKEHKLFVIPERLKLYNIEKAVTLLNYLLETSPDDVKKVKNKLNKIKYESEKKMFDATAVRVYNDTYSEVLRELYKEYKVALGEDGIIKLELSASGLDKMLEAIKESDKAEELLEYLQAKLNEVTEA